MAEEKKQQQQQEAEPAGLDVEEDNTILLVSVDGVELPVSRKFATISKLVRNAMEDPNATKVNVPNVKTAALREVIAYMEHHKGTEPEKPQKPLRSKKLSEVLSDPWDAAMLERLGSTRQPLYDVVLAANYMDIPVLMEIACAAVATYLKGVPLEQIKSVLDPATATAAAEAAKTDGAKKSKDDAPAPIDVDE